MTISKILKRNMRRDRKMTEYFPKKNWTYNCVWEFELKENKYMLKISLLIP